MVLRLRSTGASAGFSLIEVLVVVAVLSILSIGVSVRFARNDDPSAEAGAAFLQDAVEARRLAMLTGADHALAFSGEGWRLERRQAAESWLVLSSFEAAGLRVEPQESELRMVFYGDGVVSDAAVEFQGPSGAARLCEARAGGIPTCALR